MKIPLRSIAAALLLALTLPACSTSTAPSTANAGSGSSNNITRQLSETEILRRLAPQRTGVKFRSHNGQWQGTDTDVDITLAGRKRVTVTTYGDAPQSYRGLYAVHASGTIQVALKDFPRPWPAMHMYEDDHGIFLLPATRIAASAEWPFRRVK